MTPPPALIAVDLDDVLAHTNAAVAQWHNSRYGTNMTVDDFHYYHYWKNPYWGTPDETMHKVKEFYATDLMKPLPVPGALEGLKTLRKMGYTLAVVTARHDTEIVRTRAWLDQYFPDLFESITCTGQFQLSNDGKRNYYVKLSKAQVCHEMNARFLIDDSIENSLHCAAAVPVVPVLLFGDYEWNKRASVVENPEDEMDFDQRLAHEQGREWWKEERTELPRSVIRVKNWAEVVDVVRGGGVPHHN